MNETAAVKVEPDAGARERLLAAALKLFNERGYAATSVRELVSAAGVTKPVLYYYFGNKEGLFLELMRNSFADFETLVQGFSLEGSVRESIVRFLAELYEVSRARLAEVRLIYATCYGPPQGAPPIDVDAYFLRLLEFIRQSVRAGIDAGEFREVDIGDASWAIVAMFTSVIQDLLNSRENAMDRDGMVRLLRLVMGAMAV